MATIFLNPNSCMGQDPARKMEYEDGLHASVVEFDVSKQHLDVAVLQTGAEFQVGNDEAGWAELSSGSRGIC